MKAIVSLFLVVALSLAVMGCESAGNIQAQDKTEAGVTEVGLNEEIQQDGCIWAVSSIEITKELGNRPQADFNYWGESRDDAGSLTGNQSYVFVTLSCKNSSGSAREVLLNSNGFVWENEKGQLLETGSEARYISKKQSGNESAEKGFHYNLDDGEETGWIELGYIIEDCLGDNYENLYYCVGTQGSLLGNPDNRYIKVDREV